MRTSLAVLVAALSVAGCSNSAGGPSTPAATSAVSPVTPSGPSSGPSPSASVSSSAPSSPIGDIPTGGEPSSVTMPAPATEGPITDSGTQVFADCHTPVVRPTVITLACADAGVQITGISWSEWGASRALGTGTLVYNDCSPDCAQGTFHRVPGTRVTLSTPKDVGDGLVVWSRISESPTPPGYRPGPQSLPLHG